MSAEILAVLIPLAINDAALTSSTVVENDYPEWAPATVFKTGDFCISKTTHRVYQSQVDSNSGKDPTLPANRVAVGTVPAYWTDYGPTNRWAMFDTKRNTQTTATGSMTVVVHPGGFNAVWLGGIDAESVTVTVRDAPGGNVVFTASSTLEASAPGDYDEYFFSPFLPETDFLVTEIDQYNNAELTVTMTKTTGLVKCGMLAVGDLQKIAPTLRGVKIKPKSYAFIDTDGYGNTEIMPGKDAVDIDASARIGIEDARFVGGLARRLLSTPVVAIAAESQIYSDLRTFGLVSMEIDYDQPRSCLLTFKAQGMI